LHSRALTNVRIARPEHVVPLLPASSQAAAGSQTQPGDWKPTPADLRGLSRKNKTFVADWLAVHVLSMREGIVLLGAARAFDEADRWRRRSRKRGDHQARDAKIALSFERMAATLLLQLRVTQ
jgi:hypothetical protein